MQPGISPQKAPARSHQLVVPRLPGPPGPPARPKQPARASYSFPRDIYRGAILGDFAPEVRLPGAIIHALLGFVPIVGSIIALRDVIADWLDADWLYFFLNLLGVFPVFGGVPKAIAVFLGFFRVQRYMWRAKRRSASGMSAQEVTKKRVGRLRALGISLLVPAVGFFYSIGLLIVVQFLQSHWPDVAGISFSGNLPLIVVGFFALLGLVLGAALCIRTHAWLGLALLPFALLFGLLPGLIV